MIERMRRRLIQHPKHYFFDVGVLNGALGNFRPSPDRRRSGGGLHLAEACEVIARRNWFREPGVARIVE